MNETTNNIQPTNSNFFTNRNGNTLMKEFEGVLQHNNHIKNLDAVVGFLRASGYFSLRPFLDNINKVRVLIGIDVDKYIASSCNAGENVPWSRRRGKRRLPAQNPQRHRAFQLFKGSGEWHASDGSGSYRWQT